MAYPLLGDSIEPFFNCSSTRNLKINFNHVNIINTGGCLITTKACMFIPRTREALHSFRPANEGNSNNDNTVSSQLIERMFNDDSGRNHQCTPQKQRIGPA